MAMLKDRDTLIEQPFLSLYETTTKQNFSSNNTVK